MDTNTSPVRALPIRTGAGPGVRFGGTLGRQSWFRFGAAVLVLCLLFFGSLASVARLALTTDLHSHILLVPFVAGYLVWIGEDGFREPPSFSILLTALLGLGAAACLAASWAWTSSLPGDERLALRILALVLGIGACGGAFLGLGIMRECAFSFAFLLFLVPLPNAAVDLCESVLQHASAEVSAWAFDLTGTSMNRSGLEFHFPGLSVRVAQECSGFRSTLVLFIVSLVAAQMFLRSTWKKVLLVVAIFPLGVVRNAFRIWTLVTLSLNYDPKILNSWLHHRGGPIFFGLSLIPLFLLLWYLHRSDGPRSGGSKTKQS